MFFFYLKSIELLNNFLIFVQKKHTTYCIQDPFSGGIIRAYVRVQFNMFITKVEKIKLMKNYPDALLPLFWFDEIVEIPDKFIKDIRMGHTMMKLNR